MVKNVVCHLFLQINSSYSETQLLYNMLTEHIIITSEG